MELFQPLNYITNTDCIVKSEKILGAVLMLPKAT